MIVGPRPWLAVVAPSRADSRARRVKAVEGSAIRNRKSHVDTSKRRAEAKSAFRLLPRCVCVISLARRCPRRPLPSGRKARRPTQRLDGANRRRLEAECAALFPPYACSVRIMIVSPVGDNGGADDRVSEREVVGPPQLMDADEMRLAIRAAFLKISHCRSLAPLRTLLGQSHSTLGIALGEAAVPSEGTDAQLEFELLLGRELPPQRRPRC